MSETIFAAPATEQQAPAALPVQEETQAPDQRRKMLAIVAAAAVVVVALAGFFVLKGGSSNDAGTSVIPVHHVPAAPVAPVAPPKFDATFPNLPAVFIDVVGRDPFKPLVVDKPAAPAQAPSQAPAPTAVGAAGAPMAGTPVSAAQPDWVSLDSQNGVSSATFLVHKTDGTVTAYSDVKAPADGKTTQFGTYFALISLQDGFAVVQMGDAKPFNIERGYANRHMLS